MKPTRYNIVLAIAGTVVIWTTPPIIGGETTALAMAAKRNQHAEILACKPLR
jgi:hypothetical protein